MRCPLFVVVCLAVSCGKTNNNNKTGTALTYDKDIKPIVKNSCAGSDCHDQGDASGGGKAYVGNKDLLVQDKATVLSQVNGGFMPKGKSMPAADKQKLKDYLSGTEFL